MALFRAVRSYFRMRQDRIALEQMSDRLLRDVGITRAEIPAVTKHPLTLALR